MHLARLVRLSSVAVVVACGGGSAPTGSNTGGGPPPSGTVEVSIEDFSFSPSTVTVKAGTTVKWTNKGPAAHTTTSDLSSWESGTLAAPGSGSYGGGSTAGGSFSFKFTQAGTYAYHCRIHPPSAYPGFTGTIIITQ